MRGIRIRRAVPEDFSGVRQLLTQMPGWRNTLRSRFLDENIVAVDESGLIIGWLNGNHVSEAWRGVLGFAAPEYWRCSFVHWLLVHEDCRGDEVGSNLMLAFAKDSANAGRDTIIVSPQSGDDELALLRFYSRLGYRRAESGQVHLGPHGPQEDVPLPLPEEWSETSAPDPVSEAALNEYMRILGYKG